MKSYRIKEVGSKEMNWPEYNKLLDEAGPDDNIEFAPVMSEEGQTPWNSAPSAWSMKEGPIYARINNNPYVPPEPEPEPEPKGPTLLKRVGDFIHAYRTWTSF